MQVRVTKDELERHGILYWGDKNPLPEYVVLMAEEVKECPHFITKDAQARCTHCKKK